MFLYEQLMINLMLYFQASDINIKYFMNNYICLYIVYYIILFNILFNVLCQLATIFDLVPSTTFKVK